MRKKTVLISAGSAVVVVGAAILAGPALYAAYANGKADAPPSIEASVGAALTDPASLDGTWSYGADSFAGYRTHEVLEGHDVTATGRTSSVQGEATVADGALTEATITIDMASVATDEPGRDAYFRGTALEVGTFPTASFTLTEPVALPDGGATVELTGDLLVHGVTKEVTVDAQVGVDGETVHVAGSVPVTFSDYGVGAPHLPFVTVDDAGAVEFGLTLTRADG